MSILTLTGDDLVIEESPYLRVVITPIQQGNLLTLAMHLLSLPSEYPDFAMRHFVNAPGLGFAWNSVFRADCGTAACAVGHGPVAGIAYLEGENWTEYSRRAFVPAGIDRDGNHTFACYSEAWEWCFGSDWSDVDNTAHGAAHRILWLLRERGIPHDACDQRQGEAEVSYWPQVEPTLA